MVAFINRMISIFSVAILAVLIILTNANVFCRYVLDRPITWAEEASGFLLTWIIALGIIVAQVDNNHLSIPLFVERLPVFWRHIAEIVAGLVEIVLVVIFAFLAYLLAMETTKKTNLLEIHSFYFFIPYGFAGIYIAFLIVRQIFYNHKKAT